MKTLKDIAAAIDALPPEAFKDQLNGWTVIKQAVYRGEERWEKSAAHALAQTREQKKQEERRRRDAQTRRERAANVRKWLEEGYIVKGTFIKVSGARDGHGIREYISHDERTLHCRQWLPVRFGLREVVNGDKLRSRGCLKIDGRWIEPEAQMTTHEYDKVVKILS